MPLEPNRTEICLFWTLATFLILFNSPDSKEDWIESGVYCNFLISVSIVFLIRYCRNRNFYKKKKKTEKKLFLTDELQRNEILIALRKSF